MSSKPSLALSVVIPALNEQAALTTLLADLGKQRGLDLDTIVADGGSRDRTLALARSCGARVVQGKPGRGAQMNQGRAQARHPWLLFLHADSRLPRADLLATALARLQAEAPGCAGHFALRFDRQDNRASWLYRHLERKSQLNRAETIHGDQGLMLAAGFLDKLGGFDASLPFLEDHAISEKIFSQGRWILLPGQLHTSARRFEAEGPARRYFLMMLIMCARRADMQAFFRRAQALYPEQAQAGALQLGPFVDLILELAEHRAEFWEQMAQYTLDNAWQPVFVLDQALGQPGLLRQFDRLRLPLPRRLITTALAPLLRSLFRGPVREWIHRQDAAPIARAGTTS